MAYIIMLLQVFVCSVPNDHDKYANILLLTIYILIDLNFNRLGLEKISKTNNRGGGGGDYSGL